MQFARKEVASLGVAAGLAARREENLPRNCHYDRPGLPMRVEAEGNCKLEEKRGGRGLQKELKFVEGVEDCRN